MSNYIGVKCPVCSKKFTQTDDIVVCPVCGAPHHRGCYARENACAFAADHISGNEWRPPAPDPVHSVGNDPYSWNKTHGDGGGIIICGACQSKNPNGSIFCQSCGARMSFDSGSFWGNSCINIDPASMVYGGLKPDEKIEGETVRDLAVYIGQSSAYYLPRLKLMAETSRMVTFNFSAMFFSFFYFFYRKMYLVGGTLLGLFVISSIPSFLWVWANPQQLLDMMPPFMHQYFAMFPSTPVDQARLEYYQQLSNVAGTIDFAIRIALSFFANRLYYMKAMADIKQIRETQPKTHDEIAYCDTLRKKGGVNRAVIIVLVSAYFAASFIIATYISYKFLQMGGYPPQ